MIASRWTVVAAVLVIALVATSPAGSAEQTTVTTGSDAAPADNSARATRQRFLEMFARAYFPGRTGQLLVVPRKGDFITRPDPYWSQMHGSPWPYDVDIPLMFTGPAVKSGAVLDGRGARTSHQRSPPRWVSRCRRPRRGMPSCRSCEGLRSTAGDRCCWFWTACVATISTATPRPCQPDRPAPSQRMVFLRRKVNVLPSNTAVGHSTIATEPIPVCTESPVSARTTGRVAGATTCLPGAIRKICWHRRSQTYGSARPPGARHLAQGSIDRARDATRGARRVSAGRNARRSRELRSTDRRMAFGAPPASGCPIISRT
jgi:hypothetical protein